MCQFQTAWELQLPAQQLYFDVTQYMTTKLSMSILLSKNTTKS